MRYVPALGQRSASFVCTRFHRNNYTNDLWTHYLIYLIRLSGCFEPDVPPFPSNTTPSPLAASDLASFCNELCAWQGRCGIGWGWGLWRKDRGQKSSDITEAAVSISLCFFSSYFWPCTNGKKKPGILAGKVVRGEI